MANPFKTKAFQKLFQKWNKKLEKQGHEEIEDFTLTDPPLKCWHNSKWKQVESFEETVLYYQLASELLCHFEFENRTHRRIWDLHCQGLSVRQVALKVNRKKFTKTVVHTVIVGIQKKSGIKNE